MLQIGLIWLVVTAGMIVAAEAGYRLRISLARKPQHTPDASLAIMSATLSLLSLLLAFTFNMANSRFDQRRELIVAEANAISTVVLRQEALAPGDRAKLAALMRAYASTRRIVVADEANDASIAAAQRRTSNLQKQIWRATVDAIQSAEGARVAGPVLTATDEMFDMAEARRAAIEARIPPRELRILVILALGAAAMAGVAFGSLGSRHLASSSAMFALFGLAMTLVYDLDTSNKGGILTPVAALDRVIEQIALVEDAPFPPAGGQLPT